MWEAFLIAMGFAIGKLFNSSNHQQDQIDQAYEKSEHMRQLWVQAEEKAESWKRRYLSLVPTDKE